MQALMVGWRIVWAGGSGGALAMKSRTKLPFEDGAGFFSSEEEPFWGALVSKPGLLCGSRPAPFLLGKEAAWKSCLLSLASISRINIP